MRGRNDHHRRSAAQVAAATVLIETVTIICPYCWQSIDSVVDTSALPMCQVEDCAVCCQPIVVSATLGEDGRLAIEARREND